MTESDTPESAEQPFGGLKPFNSDDVELIGAARPNRADEPVPIHIGPDDDPPLGPLTLKEAYGEAIGAALAWNAEARVAAAASSSADADAFVDPEGHCPAWSFCFVAPSGERLDLDVLHGQAAPAAEPLGEANNPLTLADLADSPELIARARAQGLDGQQFILRLHSDPSGAVIAQIQSISSLQQLRVNPAL
jgi:hypothetical protein